MGRKSSIQKLPIEVRQFIEQCLRKNTFTIDELCEAVKQQFPELGNTPSRSALGRFSKGFDEMMENQRKFEYMANMLVSELGENPNDKTGTLLAQAITTLTTTAAMNALDKDTEEVTTKEVIALARAAKYTQEARALSRKERKAIEQDAREKLLREQQENLDKTARTQGLSADYVAMLKREVLGVR